MNEFKTLFFYIYLLSEKVKTKFKWTFLVLCLLKLFMHITHLLHEIHNFTLKKCVLTRAAVVYFIFRAGSTFPVPVCAVSPGHWVNKADTQ